MRTDDLISRIRIVVEASNVDLDRLINDAVQDIVAERIADERETVSDELQRLRGLVDTAATHEREACARVAASYKDAVEIGLRIAESIRDRGRPVGPGYVDRIDT